MATFEIKTKDLFKLQLKYASFADEFKKYAISQVDAAVIGMSAEASLNSSPSILPVINANSKYKRTGRLSRSVDSSPWNGSYATFSVGGNGVNYAPYVEFGTGSGFGIPAYRYGLGKNRINGFASQFAGHGGKNTNMPYRPFFFKAFDTYYAKFANKLKNFKK